VIEEVLPVSISDIYPSKSVADGKLEALYHGSSCWKKRHKVD
jgi:hypothetical protein